MKKEDFIVIIPARYASTRFPGKPLAKLGGREMILRVCDRVREAGYRLAVATDDERILERVRQAGYEAVMTSDRHRSGTDRVAEAVRKLGTGAKVVINVQGDEPFLEASQLDALAGCFEEPTTDIATLARPYPSTGRYEGLEDPNLVKVTLDDDSSARAFSRFPIPYLRGVEKELWPSSFPYLSHIGVYAYRTGILEEITRLPQSPLEKAESLEQLRWLQAGKRIRVAISDAETIGIDTPEDLAAAERLLAD